MGKNRCWSSYLHPTTYHIFSGFQEHCSFFTLYFLSAQVRGASSTPFSHRLWPVHSGSHGESDLGQRGPNAFGLFGKDVVPFFVRVSVVLCCLGFGGVWVCWVFSFCPALLGGRRSCSRLRKRGSVSEILPILGFQHWTGNDVGCSSIFFLDFLFLR